MDGDSGNLYFSVKLNLFPSMGYGSWKNFVLPACTLGYPVAAQVTRMGRSGMIDVLKEDYITATYAKGIARLVVYTKYAFKNALIPIVTIVGMQIGTYLAGAVVVETIFAWPGFGQLIFQAVGTRDYPLVQSCLLVSAALLQLSIWQLILSTLLLIQESHCSKKGGVV